MPLSDETCPHRHVKLKMTYKERLRYVPPHGINVLFYGPHEGDMRLPDNEVHATFYCPIINPNREEQCYLDDIDAELANLGRKVIQDNITEWHEPHLVKNPKIRMDVLIEKMHDDPDLEPLIKNMRDVNKTDVAESTIIEIKAKVKKLKLAKYNELKQSLLKETDRTTVDGQKIYEGTTGAL